MTVSITVLVMEITGSLQVCTLPSRESLTCLMACTLSHSGQCCSLPGSGP